MLGKYILRIWSDLIYTDSDFGFYNKPIIFCDENRYSDTYQLHALTCYSPTYPHETILTNIPEFLGFVNVCPEHDIEIQYGNYFELPEWKVELPLERCGSGKDGDEKDFAQRIMLELLQFISWHMLKSIHGRYFDIDDYLVFFSNIIRASGSYPDVDDYKKDKISKVFTFNGNAHGSIYVELNYETEECNGK